MISLYPNCEALAPIDVLSARPEKFHLTGSRFFGNPRVNSDWDFFVQHSDELELFLGTQGFVSITQTYLSPRDQEVQEVVAVYRKGHVDVQLVQDAKKKALIQEALSRYGVMLAVSCPSGRSAVWSSAYAAYNAAGAAWLHP